jgi:phage-related protein
VFNDLMVLVHIFVKKSQKTPKNEIDVAWDRMKKWIKEQKAIHEKK